MPNITGDLSFHGTGTQQGAVLAGTSGSFQMENGMNQYQRGTTYDGAYSYGRTVLNVALYNNLYGKSIVVQPSSIRLMIVCRT